LDRMAEAVERYRRFVLSLPPFERDKPYLVFGGRMLSPLDVLREMEARTPLGIKLAEAEAGR